MIMMITMLEKEKHIYTTMLQFGIYFLPVRSSILNIALYKCSIAIRRKSNLLKKPQIFFAYSTGVFMLSFHSFTTFAKRNAESFEFIRYSTFNTDL